MDALILLKSLKLIYIFFCRFLKFKSRKADFAFLYGGLISTELTLYAAARAVHLVPNNLRALARFATQI